MNYKKQITNHIPLLDQLATKRFPHSVLADEAVVYALEKLQENQGKRLAGYSGTSRFSSYFSAVVMRLFEDFSRKKFGRLRPPSWLARLGGHWLVLFRLLCMERKPYPQAVDEMMAYHHLSNKTAEHMGTTILTEIVDCGHRQGQSVSMDDSDTVADTKEGHPTSLEEDEGRILFTALFHKLTTSDTHRIADHSKELFELDFKLSGQEKILLKLCYQDGVSVSKAGEMVGLTPHQTHGRMRRLLTRIKKILNDSGLATSITPFLTA